MGIQDNYDLIVAGSGFCGSIISRLAADEGKRVLLIERRGHIAGNMYDEVDENGFIVQKYGPHIFHTDEDWIYQFISRFAVWYPYKTLYGVELDGKYIPAPFGFKAIRMLYPPNEAQDIIFRLRKHYQGRDSVPVLDLIESADGVLSAFGEMLYEKDYRPYAAKQWNLDPKELDRSVVARMPILLSERDNYYDVKYEVLPQKGYTDFFANMLDHENIDIVLDTDIRDRFDFDFQKGVCSCLGERIEIPVVFTGALEDMFESANPLPYRSLYFEVKTFDQDSYQLPVIMTYPQTHSYLRTTEYSKLMKDPPKGKTVVAFEYPVPYQKNASRGSEPYYPILTRDNIEHNNNYLNSLKSIPNFIPCGRLADYKYYNMDQAIERAFDVFNMISRKYWGREK